MSSTNTSTTNSRILKLFKSRNTLIEQLEELQYDVSEHMDFSINEIDAMNNNTQLDFTLKHNKNERKIHVKYYLTSKQINRANLDNIIEDEPNETTINKIKYLYNRDGIFVVIHNINRLQYNLLNHTLVPKCTILGNSEIDELKKKYNIMDTKQLPEISRFDPQALAKCMRPGQICKFERESSTALFYDYYRICV